MSIKAGSRAKLYTFITSRFTLMMDDILELTFNTIFLEEEPRRVVR